MGVKNIPIPSSSMLSGWRLDFVNLLRDQWVPFDMESRQSTAIQFVSNLKVKQVVVKWAHEKRIKVRRTYLR